VVVVGDLGESKREDADVDVDAVDEEAAIEDEASPEELKKPLGLTFDHYLGGGAIGFSVAVMLMVALEWLFEKAGWEASIPVRIAFSLFPSLVGATLAVFLFLRRSRRNHLMDGLKIGFSGFVITFIYTMMFRVSVGGAYIMVGFFVGGGLGGYVAKWFAKRYL
jgi:hypothetical protein